jgi:hypothetical protein
MRNICKGFEISGNAFYKQVCKNKDGSAGVRYLVTHDKTMRGDRLKTLYKKRLSVEV